MIELAISACAAGALVVEFLASALPALHFGGRLQELRVLFQQFQQSVGDDSQRERLVRHAGWRSLLLGFASLLIVCLASAIVGAAPLLLQWSEARCSQYGIAVTATASIWWMVRRRFQYAAS
jgi:hypothetical protein